MKVKLLRKLRYKGRNQISIYSMTKTNGSVTGMRIGHNDDKYSELFDFGDTKEDVLKKAERLYLHDNIDMFRKRYKKYRRSSIKPNRINHNLKSSLKALYLHSKHFFISLV